MSIKRVRHETDPVNHVDTIVLEDHFGKQHHVVVHPFLVKDKPGTPGEYEVVQVDIDAVIAQETKLMELREHHFFQHMLKHHPQHATTLSHPEHPVHNQGTGDPRQAGTFHGSPGQVGKEQTTAEPSPKANAKTRATPLTSHSPAAQTPERSGDCGCGT